MSQPDRVVVFMDYQNVHGFARSCFHPYGTDPAVGHIDPLRLGQHLVGRRKRPSVLTGVRVYRGRPHPDKQQRAAAANDRQASDWARSPLVKVIRRPLHYHRDWPDMPAVEKGIDVSLACDVVRMSLLGELDVAIIFSGDQDLLPAIETVLQLGKAHVEVAAWSGGTRIRFDGTQMPWCHYINEQVYRTLEDKVDYTQP